MEHKDFKKAPTSLFWIFAASVDVSGMSRASKSRLCRRSLAWLSSKWSTPRSRLLETSLHLALCGKVGLVISLYSSLKENPSATAKQLDLYESEILSLNLNLDVGLEWNDRLQH